MKILWFCGGILPRIARHLSVEVNHFGGWLTGLSEGLINRHDVELTIAFPVFNNEFIIDGKAGKLSYYGYPQKMDICEYNIEVEKYAESIIRSVNPDVVHIFGTEYPHTLAVVRACKKLGRLSSVLINIQGLVSVIAKHYYAGLPGKVVNSYTLRDFIRRDNIRQQADKFRKRGQYEIEAIRTVHHVSGRTDWDKACSLQINPDVQYHFCYETLRDEFYKHSWDINKCEKHSIFISHAYYPLKGLHFILEAMPEVLRRYPDAHLYIIGDDITRTGTPLIHRLKISTYGKYIKQLVEKYKLYEHITYVGMLDEKAMCDRFLKSHVFVSASSVENESNSISEAKLLGVPVIASYAGGTTERIKHHETGFYYQYDAPYMLAHYICKLFGDDNLAAEFSKKAGLHALEMHNREKNTRRMLEIYETIKHGEH